MLNTYFSTAVSDLPSSKEKILELKIVAEKIDNLNIVFWRHNNLYYAEYIFTTQPTSDILQQFANTVKNRYYQIDSQKMEQIINASQNL